MLYDLTTQERALKTLVRMTEVDESTWELWSLAEYCRLRLADFLHAVMPAGLRYERPCSHEDVRMVLVHATSSADGCASILRDGLVDLRRALVLPRSELGSFLREAGINIDVEHSLVNYRGARIDVEWHRGKAQPLDRRGSAAWRVGYRLYRDQAVCGFLAPSCALSYPSRVDLRPEILEDLDDLLGTHLVEEWCRTHEPYMVTTWVLAEEIGLLPVNYCDRDMDWFEECVTLAYEAASGDLVHGEVVLRNGVEIPPSRIAGVSKMRRA